MATVTSLTGPAQVAPGQSFQLAVGLSNPDHTTTYTGTDENGNTVTVQIDVHENVKLSTNPSDIVAGKAKPGFVVITSSDPADTLAVDSANPLSAVDVTAGLT